MIPRGYAAEAYNAVPDSENRIHSDDVARKYGFEGALVPGVTVSSYLVHPAVEAWGLAWLERGRAHVVVKNPLYDRRAFRVELEGATETAYRAVLVDATGTECATAETMLPNDAGAPPVRRGDAPVSERVPATREALERLREHGMGAVKVVWDAGLPMTSYFRNPSEMPSLLRMDGGGYANSAFLLGLTNWHFAANVALGPWVHLETDSRHFAPVPKGSDVVVEGRVVDLFEKKGHEFVDVDVTAFIEPNVPVLATRFRAIYRLRETRAT